MTWFRVLLLLFFIGIIGYTAKTIANDGWDLIAVYLSNLRAFNWSGQFTFDFTTYLLLSAIWVAWRNHFSLNGLLLGLAAYVLGILFFAPYLLLLSVKTKGDVATLLLGDSRR
ncbi:MAG: hypothetical protein AAGA62_18990 [Bacteroidota bacterium]